MSCKGICFRFRVARLPNGKYGYGNGHRYCSECESVYFTDKQFCECCGRQLRYRTHDVQLKHKHARKIKRKSYNKMYFQRRKNDPEYRRRKKIYNISYEMRNKKKLSKRHSEYMRTHPIYAKRFRERHRERLAQYQRERYWKKKQLTQIQIIECKT